MVFFICHKFPLMFITVKYNFSHTPILYNHSNFNVLLWIFHAETRFPVKRKLTSICLVVTYYGVNVIYVCIVANTFKQVRCSVRYRT